MGEHATREAEVDDLLRRGVFVDLYQVVRQSMQISHDSYSLKKVREFFMTDAGAGRGHRRRRVDPRVPAISRNRRRARSSTAIRDYNDEDCESTRQLRDWLLARKAEAEQQFGDDIPWWTQGGGGREGARRPRRQSRRCGTQLAQMARNGEPETARGQAPAALVHLVDYHRREAKPGWWAFFERLKKSLDELRDDTEAIAYLTPVGDRGADRQEVVGPHAGVPRPGVQARGRRHACANLSTARRPAGHRLDRPSGQPTAAARAFGR